MKINLLREDGVSATFIAILMPVIITILGLVIDGSYILYNRIKLDMSVDAAARAAVHSLDISKWYGERKIVLDNERAYILAEELMKKNMRTARLVHMEIPSGAPNTCIIEVEADVPLIFARIFNIQIFTIHTRANSIGYDPAGI